MTQAEATPPKWHSWPVIRPAFALAKRIQLPWLSGFSLYDLLELYIVGIIKSGLGQRAAAISYNFFMAMFPFLLFILNLIPFIPLEDFQTTFMQFLARSIPPKTYDFVAFTVHDILSKSNNSLLSWGGFLSVILSANGINALLGTFQSGATYKRGFFRQWLVSLAIAITLVVILLFTIAFLVFLEVKLHQLRITDYLDQYVPLVSTSRFLFVGLMLLSMYSIIFKYGTKRSYKRSFISVGSVFTTLLFIVSSYLFGIWVINFNNYNELYGSISTVLILMFYIWINCLVLLLGFELNTAIERAKHGIPTHIEADLRRDLRP